MRIFGTTTALVAWVLTSQAVAAPPRCDAVAGSAPVLRTGTVVLLGEIHGTVQGPEALGRLVCLALERDLDVTVGLEIPQREQDRIDRYLQGGDEAEGRADLLSGSFWQREYQDGRSSRAMLELLRSLRSYRQTHSRLRVITIDDPEAHEGRDAFMAKRLADAIAGSHDHVFFVLTGNVHNRLTPGVRWDPDYEPMGYLLDRLRPETDLVSLRLTHGGGTAWVCTGREVGDCGTRELDSQETSPAGIELFANPNGEPFSGRYHVGAIDASPPANR